MEEALFERDVALKRESALTKELEILTKKLLDQPKLFEEKNDLAIQKYIVLTSMRSQFNAERRKYCEEIQKLEILCADLSTQADRAIREKRAAESELDKITLHIPAEADRLTMALEELHSKLRASERERQEATQKLESVYQKMQSNQNQFEIERHQANERIEDTYRRLKRMEREVEDSKVRLINF